MNEFDGQKYQFYFEGGVKSYVQHLNKSKEGIGDIVYIEKEEKEGVIEIALQYTQSYQENIFTFAPMAEAFDSVPIHFTCSQLLSLPLFTNRILLRL